MNTTLIQKGTFTAALLPEIRKLVNKSMPASEIADALTKDAVGLISREKLSTIHKDIKRAAHGFKWGRVKVVSKMYKMAARGEDNNPFSVLSEMKKVV